MKKIYLCVGLCSVFALHGCFDSSDNKTKANTDGSKASVQVQPDKGSESQSSDSK